MKKLLLLTVVLLFLGKVNYAQYDSTKGKPVNLNLKEKYLLKSQRQKGVAWVLLAGGIAANALSFAFRPKDSDGFSESFDKAFVSAGILIVGTAAIITSIPLFIVSGVNKHKARLIVDTGKVELSPHIRTSSWQVKTGIAINF